MTRRTQGRAAAYQGNASGVARSGRQLHLILRCLTSGDGRDCRASRSDPRGECWISIAADVDDLWRIGGIVSELEGRGTQASCERCESDRNRARGVDCNGVVTRRGREGKVIPVCATKRHACDMKRCGACILHGNVCSCANSLRRSPKIERSWNQCYSGRSGQAGADQGNRLRCWGSIVRDRKCCGTAASSQR